MTCPKCGNEQTEAVECEACGLIFAKYRQRTGTRTQPKRSPVAAPSSNKLFYFIGTIFVVAVLIGGFLLFAPNSRPVAAVQADPDVGQVEVATPEVIAVTHGRDIVAQLNENTPASNPIEQARNATVLIKTPWGLGSGFFIRDDCTIISNRHVVQLSEEGATKFKNELAEMKLDATNLKLDIKKDKAWLKKYYDNNPNHSTRDPRSKRFEEKIVKKEEKQIEINQLIQDGEAELKNILWNNELQIILADGSELLGFASRISDDHDLALVKISGGGYCPSIAVGHTDGLHQGDRLYTVGSPMGVRHTVTSGIYSGSIELDGNQMLQTDAPINPGNSGGPLIDQKGRVLGVNTLVLKKAQGIGFAIPIDQAIKTLKLM